MKIFSHNNYSIGLPKTQIIFLIIKTIPKELTQTFLKILLEIENMIKSQKVDESSFIHYL